LVARSPAVIKLHYQLCQRLLRSVGGEQGGVVVGPAHADHAEADRPEVVFVALQTGENVALLLAGEMVTGHGADCSVRMALKGV